MKLTTLKFSFQSKLTWIGLLIFWELFFWLSYAFWPNDTFLNQAMGAFIEAQWNDWKHRFWARKKFHPASSIEPYHSIIIAIDDDSLGKWGRWPWNRCLMATFLNKLDEFQFKTIVLDIVFSEPQNVVNCQPNPQNSHPQSPTLFDLTLAETLKSLKTPITLGSFGLEPEIIDEKKQFRTLACQWVASRFWHPAFEKLIWQDDNLKSQWESWFQQNREIWRILLNQVAPFMKIPHEDRETWLQHRQYCQIIGSAEDPYWELAQEIQFPQPSEVYSQKRLYFSDWTFNLPLLAQNSNTALISILPDWDGVIRRYSLFYPVLGSMAGFPSLTLAALKTATPIPAQWFEQEFWEIPYLGPSFSIPHVPAYLILENEPKLWGWINHKNGIMKIPIEKEQLRSKIAYVGVTATAVADVRPVVTDRFMPGVEIHAQLTHQILSHVKPFTRKSLWSWFPMAVFITIVGVFILWFHPKLEFFGLTWGLSVLSQFFWEWYSLMFEQALTSFNWAIVYQVMLLVWAFGFIYSQQLIKQKVIKQTFEKYVSPQVVRYLLRNSDFIDLEGQKRYVTIFFSDVRQFTTFSETQDPKDLIRILNNYLEPMTDIILKHHGTLDKFMGDGIMAFWGAPNTDEEHAWKACLCALEQLKWVKSEGQKLAQGFQWKIGIGINTDWVAVGNVGSKRLRNYTVIGDGVNTAARLEGATKFYQVSILLGESTANLVQDKLMIRPVDRVKFKGKNRPSMIWELCDPQEIEPTQIQRYLSIFQNLIDKNWSLALKLMEAYMKDYPQDAVTQLHYERLSKNPTLTEWLWEWHQK